MNPLFIALGILGGFASASASIRAGEEKRRQKYQEAIDTEIERKQAAISAQQQQNARLRDYAEAKSMNEAFFAYAGRSKSDRSVKAFLDYNRETAYEDVTRIANTSLIKDLQFKSHANNLKRAGDYAQSGSYATAFSTIISAGLNTARSA